jgi:hypothetical protein
MKSIAIFAALSGKLKKYFSNRDFLSKKSVSLRPEKTDENDTGFLQVLKSIII